MIIKKLNNNLFKIGLRTTGNLIFYNHKKKITFKSFAKQSNLKIFSAHNLIKLYTKIVSCFVENNFYSYFTKINLIGLGFKNFVFNYKLYILIGDCNYLIFNIPQEIKIICKKNQIYGLSESKSLLFIFFSFLKKLKKINFYKGKGILEFSNFKFMKLKIGKKQKT